MRDRRAGSGTDAVVVIGVIVALLYLFGFFSPATTTAKLPVSDPAYTQGGHEVEFKMTVAPGDVILEYFEETAPTPTGGFVQAGSYTAPASGEVNGGFSIPYDVIGFTYPVTYTGSVYFVDQTTGATSATIPWSTTVSS